VFGPSRLHLTNVLGALAVVLSDQICQASEAAAAGPKGAGPAALVALHEFPGTATMEHLASAVGLTQSGAVRLVDRLTSEQYVERRAGADGRSIAVVLTASGETAALRVLAARAAVVNSVLIDLSDDERRSLAAISDKILATVTEARLADRDAGETPAGGWLCRLCDVAACGRADGACPSLAATLAHYRPDFGPERHSVS
jgi:DNA-binding MarR family transcriptional regulator